MRKYSHDNQTRHTAWMDDLYVQVRILAIENLIAVGIIDEDFDPPFGSREVEGEINRIFQTLTMKTMEDAQKLRVAQ
jgi:hypothetical protein